MSTLSAADREIVRKLVEKVRTPSPPAPEPEPVVNGTKRAKRMKPRPWRHCILCGFPSVRDLCHAHSWAAESEEAA